MSDEQYPIDDEFEEPSAESDLPPGWIWVNISDILEINYGKGLTEATRIKSGEVPVYGSNGVVGHHNEALTNGPTIVIGRKGTVGSVYLSKIGCWPIDTTYYTQPSIQLLNQYIYYALKFLNLVKLKKSTIPGLNRDELNNQQIPLPPLTEQHRIVAELEAQLSQLDNAIDNLKRQQTTLQTYKASVLNSACKGTLVEQDPTDEPASQLLQRILAERRARWEAEQQAKDQAAGKLPLDGSWKQNYPEPMSPDTNDLPDLPDGWVWATLEQIAADEPFSITDGPFGSKLKTEHYTKNGPRVIRLQNIGNGDFIDEKAYISQDKFQALRRHEIFANDLVIAGLGDDLPRSCIIPTFVGLAIVKADSVRFKPDSNLAKPAYINYVLNSKFLKDFAKNIVHGLGRLRLNQQDVKTLIIPLPPLTEQQRIVVKVERLFSTVQQQAQVLETSLKESERIRQAFLQRAFRGELVPQDPQDEPAEKLLDRIRAEREEREKQRQADLAEARANPVKKEKKKMSTQQQRRPIREVLLEATDKKLSPGELFSLAGFTVETIEEFYDELRKEVRVNRQVIEERPGTAIYLKAVS